MTKRIPAIIHGSHEPSEDFEESVGETIGVILGVGVILAVGLGGGVGVAVCLLTLP